VSDRIHKFPFAGVRGEAPKLPLTSFVQFKIGIEARAKESNKLDFCLIKYEQRTI